MTFFITANEAAGMSVAAASEKSHEALSKAFVMSAYEEDEQHTYDLVLLT